MSPQALPNVLQLFYVAFVRSFAVLSQSRFCALPDHVVRSTSVELISIARKKCFRSGHTGRPTNFDLSERFLRNTKL